MYGAYTNGFSLCFNLDSYLSYEVLFSVLVSRYSDHLIAFSVRIQHLDPLFRSGLRIFNVAHLTSAKVYIRVCICQTNTINIYDSYPSKYLRLPS